MNNMIAVVLRRDGELPVGGDETIAECGGNALVLDIDGLAPAGLARALAPMVKDADVVVLPASPDGRDLAPRLAAQLGWPLLANAMRVQPGRASIVRRHGLVIEEHTTSGPFVATLQPGGRDGFDKPVEPTTVVVDQGPAGSDPEVLEVTTPAASELDLAEAKRILGVGAGLGDIGFVELAGSIAAELGMTLGATRVVTDWGWLPFELQIGTTGALVDPDVYVAFAISGAVQHVSGLGNPDHIVSVNLDGSCPMAALADVNLVTDAPAVLVAMADRLGLEVDSRLRELTHVNAAEVADA